jgi:glutathione S-transferase
MPLTIDEIYNQALLLPDDSQESLAERLMAHVAAKIDPAVERAHLAVAKQRRDEARSGQVTSLDGKSVMDTARQIAGG